MINEKLNLNENKNSFSNVNYWREIEKNIDYELKNLNGLILLVHNSAEFSDLLDFLKNFRKGEFSCILYISLVRSYEYMKKALDLKPIDDKRIIFIDCVSGYAFPTDDEIDNAFYHRPPQTLEEMEKIIKYGIDKSNPDIIIVDSFSQFINFSKSTKDEINQLYESINKIKKETMNTSQNTIILFYDSKLSVIKNLPKTAVDTILKIEKVEKL